MLPPFSASCFDYSTAAVLSAMDFFRKLLDIFRQSYITYVCRILIPIKKTVINVKFPNRSPGISH